jgi:protein-L-isoaspartate O-methyltransferase
MPIARLLANSDVSLEQRSVLESAFAATLRKLNLVDRNDPICEMVAQKVLEVAAGGGMSAAEISEIASTQLDPR